MVSFIDLFVMLMFLYVGFVHVGMNMYVFVQGGCIVERLFGPSAFAVLYLLAGVAGSVTSLFVHLSM